MSFELRRRSRTAAHPLNATGLAAALAERAEDVCRRYLPGGRRQGNYWTAGDTGGGPGRSLFVRLAPPGRSDLRPGKWTDAATGQHGDLLDLIRLHIGAASLRPAMDEARAFLALEPAPDHDPGPAAAADGDSGDSPGVSGDYDREAAARRLWRRCRPVEGSHAEAYLRARAIGHCRFPALRFHPDLLHRDDTGVRRLPALVAAVTGNAGDASGGDATGSAIDGVQRTWLDPGRPAKADLARPRKALGRVHGRAVRFGALRFGAVTGATLLAGEGIETVLSLVTAVPGIDAAAALSAGSLGAFDPPPGLARLIVARDNDAEGERAFQRLERRCAARGIAAIAIVSDLGDFNDDLVAFGADTLAARIGPLFAPGVASPIAAVPPMATPETRNGGELGSVPS